ncbi:MAG: phosphotransferase [Actinomycetaceae bacterium]|nr:phosphotransferase [Actinomycetaceae bacterium]
MISRIRRPVDNAIILAAGFGSRFVPYTFEVPKGLVEVDGIPMIESQIKQLHEAGVTEIIIVTGYLRDKYRPLINQYGLTEIYNPEYARTNTISSLWVAREHLKNTYILSSDNLLLENLYRSEETSSWYSLAYAKEYTSEWCVTLNDSDRITDVNIGGADSWHMYGPVFFTSEFSHAFVPLLDESYAADGTSGWYWEDVLNRHLSELPPMYGRKTSDGVIWEFESWEELREFDSSYCWTPRNQCIETICSVFGVKPESIYGIECLKQGMSNQSFTFWLDGERFVYRKPGPGSEQYVDRENEGRVNSVISRLELADDCIFFDTESGRKISRFISGARSIDPMDWGEVSQAMKLLRRLHQSGAQVSQHFSLVDEIDHYESLVDLDDARQLWDDFDEVRGRIKTIIQWIGTEQIDEVLCHNDSNATNFLIDPDGRMYLIDWEFAGMGDPLLDCVMFGLYSSFGPIRMKKLWEVYLQREPSSSESQRLNAYVALGGYLWSLWVVSRGNSYNNFEHYRETQFDFARVYSMSVEAQITSQETSCT